MIILNKNNSIIDKNSGGILFKGSPEFLEIFKLRKQISELENKYNDLFQKIKVLEKTINTIGGN